MEFINGEIYLLASPNINHQKISGRLYLRFSSFLKGKKYRVFYAPFDVHFSKKDFKIDEFITYKIGEKLKSYYFDGLGTDVNELFAD